MSSILKWWEKPKPITWVAWSDYCGAAGVYALWLIYERGVNAWQGSVVDAVTWPIQLINMGWLMIGGQS